MTPTVAFWILLLTIVTFVGSMAAVACLLVRLPPTYFLERHHHGRQLDRHPVLHWSAVILRNLLGVVLVGIGILMLFTPGQGVLTVLMGIMLMDFPGKRAFERKLLARHSVQSAINRLRAKSGRPPLLFEEE